MIASYQNSQRRDAAIAAFKNASSRAERELLMVLAVISANVQGGLLPAGESLESLRATVSGLSDAALYEQYEMCLPRRQPLTSHGLAQWLISQPDRPIYFGEGGEGGEALEAAVDDNGVFLS